MGDLHADGEANVIGILFHQLLQLILLQVLAVFALFLLGVGLDVHDDIGAGGVLLRLCDGVAVSPVRLPAPCLLLAVFSGDDGDVVCHHERGIKAHAELADDVGIVLGLLALLLPEAVAAAGGNYAQIVFQLLAAHADAVVTDGEGAGLFVNLQADGKVAAVHANLVVGQGQVAQLVNGV